MSVNELRPRQAVVFNTLFSPLHEFAAVYFVCRRWNNGILAYSSHAESSDAV